MNKIVTADYGEDEHQLLGVPNNYLIEDLTGYAYLGIKHEGDNEEFIYKISSYVSKILLSVEHSYRDGSSNIKSIQNNEKFILFLIYPDHWYLSFWQQLKVFIIVLIIGPVSTDSIFKRI